MAVPTHIFDEAWIKGNFIIPGDPTIRAELVEELKGYFADTKIVFATGNERTRVILQARLTALEAHNNVLSCNPTVKI